MDGCNRDRGSVVAAERGKRDVSALARIIWETSRADEGTISAAGANIIAMAILRSDWMKQHDAEVRAEALRPVRGALANHPDVCDRYTDEDVISCGWKRAVVGVRAALAGEGGDRD